MKKRNILRYTIYAIIILFITVAVHTKFFPDRNGIFGLKIYSVSTASMSPKLHVGDVILVKKTAYNKIKVGDIISYKGAVDDLKGKIITHQVQEITTEANRYIYYTKGTANIIEDPAVYQDQVYGVMIYKTIIISIISKLMKNVFGFIFIVLLPLVLLFKSELKELIQLIKKKKN